MCAYMPNPDLISMLLVCRNWNPTCMRHISTQLSFDALESFKHPPNSKHVSALEELVSCNIQKKHLRLLASLYWPSLTSLSYGSKRTNPHAVLHLLNRAPKLKWLKISIQTDTKFFPSLAKMFGQMEWSNLQGLCMRNEYSYRKSPPLNHIPAVQKACPNARIHVKHSCTVRDSYMVSIFLHSVAGSAITVSINTGFNLTIAVRLFSYRKL
jgi:hypothetical protein